MSVMLKASISILQSLDYSHDRRVQAKRQTRRGRKDDQKEVLGGNTGGRSCWSEGN